MHFFAKWLTPCFIFCGIAFFGLGMAMLLSSDIPKPILPLLVVAFGLCPVSFMLARQYWVGNDSNPQLLEPSDKRRALLSKQAVEFVAALLVTILGGLIVAYLTWLFGWK